MTLIHLFENDLFKLNFVKLKYDNKRFSVFFFINF